MSRRRAKNLRSLLVVSFVLFLLVLFFFFLKEQSKYTNVFFKHTVINGVDCSLLTVDEASEMIQTNVEEYSLEILFKDADVETIFGSEIGYTIKNLNKSLENIKETQKRSITFKGKKYTLDDYTYDIEKLKAVLSSKKQLQKDYMEDKTQIKYEFNPDSKLFEVSEQNSYKLNFNEVYKSVSEAIRAQNTQVSLEGLYSSSDTSSILERMNSYIGAEITYQLPNGEEYVLDADTLHLWLKQKKSGKYVKNDTFWKQNIEDFVLNTLAPLANTVYSSKEFMPTGMSHTVLVEGGNYGYLVDTEAEIQLLQKELLNGIITVRNPCYKSAVTSSENYGFGNSYVEIDLSRQKVWVYKDGALKVETDCVTGCINKGHETPTGIFTLTYKQTDRVLRGRKLPNGRYEYASHVNYWMPFNGGIGLHDATWRSSFGGNIYITNGSHGCINLPLSEAEKVYDIIDYDMPIIVYKSE